MSSGRQGGRAVARDVLRRVRRDGAYSNLALAAAFARSRHLAATDRALATELVYGVLRHQRRLDHVLGQQMSRPIAQVDADVLDILRLAAYQILLLDRIPPYAAVNDAVGAVRALRGGKVAGFANAVLRKLDPALLVSGLPADPNQRLAVETSLPAELADQLIAQLGVSEARELADALLERALLAARVNSAKATRDAARRMLETEGATVEECRWSPAGLRIRGLAEPFVSESYLRGMWTAQDEAAQCVGMLLGARPGEAVLDACAGVGGKATHLAEQMIGRGDSAGADGLLCVDVSRRKLDLLREHASRLDLKCQTLQADLTDREALEGRTFDRVLLDAPCTGLGVLRRHPELKWNWDAATRDRLIRLQRDLLRSVVGVLRPGGVLVYSVCTITEEEGPQQLQWLLSEYPHLKTGPSEADALGFSAELWDGTVMRSWPHRHQMDGFFAARVVRE